MIRWIRVFVLKCREQVLLAQIDHGQALLLDHRERLQNCQTELRAVRTKIAMRESASNLLTEALRSRHTR